MKARFKVGDVVHGKITAVYRDKDGAYRYKLEGLRDFIPESKICPVGADFRGEAKFAVGEEIGNGFINSAQFQGGEVLYTVEEVVISLYSEEELEKKVMKKEL